MQGLTKEDYDYFRECGFEVVKSSMGKYYIRSCNPKELYNLEGIHKAKAAAIQCGFAFDHNGDILAFNRKNNE